MAPLKGYFHHGRKIIYVHIQETPSVIILIYYFRAFIAVNRGPFYQYHSFTPELSGHVIISFNGKGLYSLVVCMNSNAASNCLSLVHTFKPSLQDLKILKMKLKLSSKYFLYLQ